MIAAMFGRILEGLSACRVIDTERRIPAATNCPAANWGHRWMKVRQEWSGRQGALLHHRQSNEQREDKHGQEKGDLGV